MTWNFDMSAAPKGGLVTKTMKVRDGERTVEVWEAPRIIAASKCGLVTTSRWLHDVERWEMFSKGGDPIAWQPWPDHPGLEV